MSWTVTELALRIGLHDDNTGRRVGRPVRGRQLPMRPPSFFVMTMVAERGRLPAP